ncbi:unnamed protein product [Cuscuta campestris]|uniref:Leucine-rich repeat-containing N-terminal plant-type domain-containing protein n=1 Tax=Cuscuta campestris TaxID=132261 RepID=A0A484MJK6_9ASTE|nr:unnamed protein product [Cuscuta campestris]
MSIPTAPFSPSNTLNLAYNDLQQSQLLPLYASFSSSLTHLNLSSSNMIGEIPVELSGLSGLVKDLVMLDLSFNNGLRLESSVWAALVQKMTRLREVGLDRVRMVSIEPSTAFSGFSPALTTLTLNQCDLKGEFPASVMGLPNLQKLVLSENGELTGGLLKHSMEQFTQASRHPVHQNCREIAKLNRQSQVAAAFGCWRLPLQWVHSSFLGEPHGAEVSESDN